MNQLVTQQITTYYTTHLFTFTIEKKEVKILEILYRYTVDELEDIFTQFQEVIHLKEVDSYFIDNSGNSPK